LDEAHQKFLHDHATDVEESHIKGKIKGKIDTARNMKSKGFDVDIISRITGLTTEVIEQLD